METNTNYSLREYIQASPSSKFITPILLSLLIFEHWRHYGLENPSHAGSWLLSFWPILIVLGLSVLDGIIRYCRKSSTIPLKEDARYKKCSQINLYLFFSWLAVSTVSRIFLSSSIDRFVALYVGPAIALFLFINVIIYFVRSSSKKKLLSVFIFFSVGFQQSFSNDVILENSSEGIDVPPVWQKRVRAEIEESTLHITSEENIDKVTINDKEFTLINVRSVSFDVSDYPVGTRIIIETDSSTYIGYID